MNEERKMILQMLNDGKINVDEAERLLDALNNDGDASRPLIQLPQMSPRRLHITILEADSKKADVRLPLALARAGLKVSKSFSALGGRLARDAQETEYIMDLLESIDIDELMNSLQEGTVELPHTLINAENRGRQVMIVLE